MIDRNLARLDELGATIVLTADHGMNAKHGADGQPNVIYLQDALDGWFGKEGAGDPADHRPLRRSPRRARLLRAGVLPRRAPRSRPWRERIGALPGIEIVLARAEAAARFELPADRIGDLVVVSTSDTVIGTSRDRHDLSGLDVPLRSHGGLSEQKVPLIMNRRIGSPGQSRRWRNFDAFDLGLNLATTGRRGRAMSVTSPDPAAMRAPIRESLRIAGEKIVARPRDRGASPFQRRADRHGPEGHARGRPARAAESRGATVRS